MLETDLRGLLKKQLKVEPFVVRSGQAAIDETDNHAQQMNQVFPNQCSQYHAAEGSNPNAD